MNGLLHHLIDFFLRKRLLLEINISQREQEKILFKRITNSSFTRTKVQTLRVRHGRETAKLKAITRVPAETPAPTKGGLINRLAITPQTSVANAIPYKIRNA
jgi:hypothetical protein